jgi:prokaryotic ubiquitin-like protein Pup
MAQAQKQTQRTKQAEETAPQETTSQETQQQESTMADEVDAMLEEIDEVLEENAEEFVRSYVQKGGQ